MVVGKAVPLGFPLLFNSYLEAIIRQMELKGGKDRRGDDSGSEVCGRCGTGDDDPTRAGENLKEFREVCVREEEEGEEEEEEEEERNGSELGGKDEDHGDARKRWRR